MDHEGTSVMTPEAKEVEFLFLDSGDKAPCACDCPANARMRRRERAAEVALWLIFVGGIALISWEHVSLANAARAAGIADNRLSGLGALAQILLMALVLTRMARMWMGYGTTVLQIQVRKRMIEMTPKWDEGIAHAANSSQMRKPQSRRGL